MSWRRSKKLNHRDKQGGKEYGMLKTALEAHLDRENRSIIHDEDYEFIYVPALAQRLNIYKKKFMEFDTDLSGDINFGEFKRLLEYIGETKTHLKAKKLFKRCGKIEKGIKGVLTYRNFVDMLLGDTLGVGIMFAEEQDVVDTVERRRKRNEKEPQLEEPQREPPQREEPQREREPRQREPREPAAPKPKPKPRTLPRHRQVIVESEMESEVPESEAGEEEEEEVEEYFEEVVEEEGEGEDEDGSVIDQHIYTYQDSLPSYTSAVERHEDVSGAEEEEVIYEEEEEEVEGKKKKVPTATLR